MLSLLACFGAQPKRTSGTSIQVYSKLGGTFLGAIQRPCLKNVDAYSVLRKLQDQVASWLYHPKMPPRYLALFVGTSRLSSPDFPFVDHLDAESSQQVLGALGEAKRLDAIWENDLECAKSRLASKGLRVKVEGYKLSLEREFHDVDLKQLLPIEVEAFTFGVTIRYVWVNTRAETLGCLHLFPHLEKLSCNFLKDVDFKRLTQVKTLTNLHTRATCLTDDVGLISSLKVLSFEASAVGCIPTTIGLLPRLTDLVLEGRGFTQTIPSELGQLGELTSLAICSTHLSGSIPSELCQLTKLAKLSLAWNDRLGGSLPNEFCNLKLLSYFNLYYTPVETNGLLNGWKNHSVSHLEQSYWTRKV
jgi:hypothetical protein